MQDEGIDHTFVIQDSSTTTSLGIPMIDPNGENSIIGIPRANTRLTVTDLKAVEEYITQHQFLLLQNEIPLATSLQAVATAHRSGMTVIFNPAPAVVPLQALLPRDSSGDPMIDWLVPNEIEAEMLSGMPVKDPVDAINCAKFILSQGVRRGVVITLGSRGVIAVTPGEQYHQRSFPVISVDPTGAGDAFCGSFAVALSEGKPIEQALRFANAAGALAVTRAGAEPSLPERSEIEVLLNDHT
jgi:ribokinase